MPQHHCLLLVEDINLTVLCQGENLVQSRVLLFKDSGSVLSSLSWEAGSLALVCGLSNVGHAGAKRQAADNCSTTCQAERKFSFIEDIKYNKASFWAKTHTGINYKMP